MWRKRCLAEFAARRYPVLPFMARAYQLRANITPYDAVYVALAEELGCSLLTLDARLARSPGPQCPIRVLSKDSIPSRRTLAAGGVILMAHTRIR